MMLRGRSWVSVLAVVLSLCCGVVATGRSARPQSLEKSLDWLSPESLRDLGVHLPSYLPSVQAQMTYQVKVPLHQEITVKWSVDGGGQPSAGPGFVLVKRWQHMQKSARISPLKPKDRPILVIATTPGGEVRAFALHADTRSTTAQLDLQLPQDGQISRLIFLNVTAGSGLERIGEVKLGLPDGALQIVSKEKVSRGVPK